MDLLFSQSEQASDQSLFSQKTDTISEAYSTSSPADTPSIGETTQKLVHTSQASQRLIDETTDERLQVIPETEESSPQEGGLTEPCVPESPQSKLPDSAASDVQRDFAIGSEREGDKSTVENIAREDTECHEVNDDNSDINAEDSDIYSKRRNSNTLIDDDASNHSVELPGSALGESTHQRRRVRLLDDSDDEDSLSDSKLPESIKSRTDVQQEGDGAFPDASNLNEDSLEVPPSAPEDDTAKKPRRIRVLDDSDDEDDSTSEPKPQGVEPASNSDAVRGDESEAEAGQSLLEACRRICDSSDDEAVDDVSRDSIGDDENTSGPCEPERDGEATEDVQKKERGGRKSAKKAMEELKQIYSTSQRMARERQMSLPYHEPERLSLKDFLQQRRSAGSQSSSTCKKEEETTATPIPSSGSSKDPLLDDLPAVLDTPNSADDEKCSGEPVMTETTPAETPPAEKQPVESSSLSSGSERVQLLHLSARRRRNLEAIAAGVVPRLSQEPVILLADDSNDHPKGVDHLLERLVKHAKVDDAKKKKESIKATAIVVPGIIEECPISQKGVSQLSVLKERLLTKVREQRNRSREQRYLQQCLNNEELLPDAIQPDDAPKSPLALADEFEEENDFSDNDTSSGGEEEKEEDGNNSDDDDVVLKHKKRAKRINPLSDDEDPEDAEETKKTLVGIVEDEDEDSIGELHLEMPAFLDTEDNLDQPEMGDETGAESFLDSSQVANSQSNARTPLIQKSRAVRGFQCDEAELFSPLTGLPRTQSKMNTPQQGSASASSSFQESPMGSSISRPLSLAFSPLAGTAGALTACRSLRRQFSEDCAKPWEGGTPAPVNPSQDMDELVGLCSGSFGARAQADKVEEKEEDDEDMPVATLDEPDEDVNESDDEPDDDVVNDSAGEPDEDDVENDSEVESTPAAKEEAPALKLQDFFEDEAELSGSDVGSDGEDEDDEEGVLADLIAAENGKEDDDKIREEIGRFHFKQLLDEDKRELKIYQELLLEDGDLHSDGAGRQRQFRWRNSGTDDLDQQPGSEGEEEAQNETEQEADTTWRLQRLERRRWLQEQESSQNPETHDSASFSEQESLLKAPAVIARQDSFSNKPAAKKRAMCGSFLKLDSGVLGRIAERIKVAPPTEVEGSVTTKNFVFRAAEEKPQKKRPSVSQPSKESKKPKLVELSEKKELKISVFNFM
ncbi:claspin [Rhipicephalus sanguineus]|uniref:claspin n=1 Tax=Rhipicephalus sanguineus TaxID=34632 RepID=UPI0018932B71|nr:claspin [Rhipicephalus sanguineus]